MNEFWHFVTNEPVYDDLVEVFHEAGKTLRPELDERFKKFRQ